MDVGEGMCSGALDPKRAEPPECSVSAAHPMLWRFEFASPHVPRSALPVRSRRMPARWSGLRLSVRSCPIDPGILAAVIRC